MTDNARACLEEAGKAALHMVQDFIFLGLLIAAFVVFAIVDAWEWLGRKVWAE